MEGIYTKQCGAQYTFTHDFILEVCANQYGQQFPDQILLYMSSTYIANHVKLREGEQDTVKKMKEKQRSSQSSAGSESGDDGDEKWDVGDEKSVERGVSFDLCIRLREDQYPLLAQRLYRDIQNMELYDVFRNQVLKHPLVCQAFICELERKPYTELKILFLSSQGKVDKIVSKQKCVEKGSVKRSGLDERWRQQVLVDGREEQNDKGECVGTHNVRVISWVIYYGHHQILQYIVQQIDQHHEISELFGITENTPPQSQSKTEQNGEYNTLVGQSESEISKKIRISNTFTKENKMEKSGTTTSIDQNSEHSRLIEQSESGTSRCSKHKGEHRGLMEEYRLLLLGCYGGDVQTVKVLLPHVCKKAINRLDQVFVGSVYNDTPLRAACEGGHVSVVKELIKAGALVNLKNREGDTPMTAACEGGHVSVVKELMKAGANVNPQNRQWNTPMISACRGGHVNVVQELVKVMTVANIQGVYPYTPLITACEGGHVSVVNELVKAGADVNLQNGRGDTPLTAACGGGYVCVVEELLNAGADINLQDKWGTTPLIAAVREGSLSTVRCLIEHGADWVTHDADTNMSAVYTALILRKSDLVKYLVKTQNRINSVRFAGNVHLFNCLVDIRHAAVKTDSRDNVVVADRSVWCMDRDGYLWKIIRCGFVSELRGLLYLGLNASQLIQWSDFYVSQFLPVYNKPLLHILINEWHVNDRAEKVRILLEAGMDVNARVKDLKYDFGLYREGISALERTKRLMCQFSKSQDWWDRDVTAPEYKSVMWEIKRHVRRYSV
jgi:ankyrin repeat protein